MAEAALDQLIDALRRLPGVGVKSAQRMAFHLLQHDRDGARRLAAALTDAMQHMRHCQRCHTYTAGDVCSTCLDPPSRLSPPPPQGSSFGRFCVREKQQIGRASCRERV